MGSSNADIAGDVAFLVEAVGRINQCSLSHLPLQS